MDDTAQEYSVKETKAETRAYGRRLVKPYSLGLCLGPAPLDQLWA